MSITGAQVVEKIRSLGRENPNHKYEKQRNHPASVSGAVCFYVHHTPEGREAGCIVGKALADLGVSLDLLEQTENEPGEIAVRHCGISLSEHDAYFIQHAQTAQDQGKRWGRAVSDAEAALDHAYPQKG